MCDHSNDLADMAKSMERIDRKVTELHKLIIGNGEPTKGLIYRVAFLEFLSGNSPTWRWVMERVMLPIAMLGIGAYIATAIK